MFKLSDYDYHLDEQAIAQKPVRQRDQSKLLRLKRTSGRISHHIFSDIVDLLSRRDILVVNNTRVIPGRLIGRKSTGGKVEVLIIDLPGGRSDPTTFTCQCLVKASKAPRAGTQIYFDHHLRARIVDGQHGVYTVTFYHRGDIDAVLKQVGRVPLPPYIKRQTPDSQNQDRSDYQTVYASQGGAVAAPTAGLHFTESLLARLNDRGVRVVALTLHVSYGTFLPVRVGDIRQHKMHAERFVLTPETTAAIQRAKAAGGRVVAVGTTSVRTLEFAADAHGRLSPQDGACDLFIYPGYRFKIVDAMITNFHLPQSTLLMLVSAFAGRESILDAYAEAIREKYRFYSYGDAMLID